MTTAVLCGFLVCAIHK